MFHKFLTGYIDVICRGGIGLDDGSILPPPFCQLTFIHFETEQIGLQVNARLLYI